MTGDALRALALRCEQATGPDRELDRAIFDSITGGRYWPEFAQFWRSADSWGASREPARITANLEIALTLVPEGWDWSLASALLHMKSFAKVSPNQQLPRASSHIAEGSTPTLAICAAALKTRAVLTDQAREAGK